MRRREKFVISAILLSLAMLATQWVPLDQRYWAVAVFGLIAYFVSVWTLIDDLQWFEWLTIVPFPTLYAVAVSLFYFLLPENFVSRFFIIGLFGVGMYASFLTSNIYSVAKARTIQLVHAAHAVGLLLTLITSLLLTNTIYSLQLPWYINGLAVGLVHWPLIYMSLWSIKLEQRITPEPAFLALILALLLVELAVLVSLFPITIWNSALMIMTLLYIGLGVLQSYLRDSFFSNSLMEYSLVAALLGVLFLFMFPGK